MAVLFLAACGQTTKDNKENTAPKTEEKAKQEDKKTAAKDDRLKEPTKETKCAYCNMEVYDATHEMGAFTAQGIKADGTNAFFDDVGCILNQERLDGKTMEKFVRDYNTKNWVALEKATIVKSDVKTPMNYGFAFFEDKESAEKFVKEHSGATISDVAAIDTIAAERHKKKMEKMGQNNSGGHGDSNGHGH